MAIDKTSAAGGFSHVTLSVLQQSKPRHEANLNVYSFPDLPTWIVIKL